MATVISPREGEKLLFTIRKNIFRFSKQILKSFVLIVISVSGFVLFSNEIITGISAVILLFALVYAFYYFMIWFYDVYIITNKRVICVEQKSPFSKEFSEIEVEKIHDVTYSIRGVFATLLRYGTVVVKGQDITLELADLTYPDEVQEMIKKLSDGAKKSKSKEDVSAQELIDLIVNSRKK